jgi:NAD(P)-dependent dehydrogenase (short-subunit alcohol dehydrogenase family)
LLSNLVLSTTTATPVPMPVPVPVLMSNNITRHIKDSTKNTKIAVITGGGTGIGQAVAIQLAINDTNNKHDWIIVICGRTISTLLQTKEKIQKQLLLLSQKEKKQQQQEQSSNSTRTANYDDDNDIDFINSLQYKCCCIVADVTNENDVQQLFQTIRNTYGTPIENNSNNSNDDDNYDTNYYCSIDLLFNNAGCNPPSCVGLIDTIELKEFTNVLQTNVIGPFLCTREAIRCHLHAIKHIEHKQQQQQQNHGCFLRIINNGSISAHAPRPYSICYTTSKHAISGLTKSIALDGRNNAYTCCQIDFGNITTQLSLDTNNIQTGGAIQPNGTKIIEPTMSLIDSANTIVTMANLPPKANMLYVTMIATTMPFVGCG